MEEVEEALARFLDEIRQLDPVQLHAMAALRDPSGELETAQREVVQRSTLGGWTDDLARVEGTVRDFCSRQLATTGQESGAGMRDVLLTEARRAAGLALIDAAVALIFYDKLSAQALQVLEGPYVAVRASKDP
jgi:hypothetical protein